MNDEQIRQIDLMSNAVYGATSTQEERLRAEAMLKEITTFENLPALRCVFERSTNHLSHFLMAKSMNNIVTEHWHAFKGNKEAPVDLRNWLVRIINTQGLTMDKQVLPQLIHTLCRLEKLGWLDHPSFQELPKEVHEFFIMNPSSPQHVVVGLMILKQLVDEISVACSRQTPAQHRKTVLSFRDNCLFDIFTVSLTVLRSGVNNPTSPEVREALTVALAILNFDFAGGVFHDESSDDQGAMHVPSAWKTVIADPATLELFWTLYRVLPCPQSADILKCCTQFACCRRSLFSDDTERGQHLNAILGGVLGILQAKVGLEKEENYFEFCRLLGKIKPNYQLAEMTRTSHFIDWLTLTAQFTMDSFVNWRDTANCSFYLLTLWSKLVQACVNVRPSNSPEATAILLRAAPDIVLKYVQSRLELARVVVEGTADVENTLEDPDSMMLQLDPVKMMGQIMYAKVGPFLMQTAMGDYQQMKETLQHMATGQIPPNQQQQVLVTLQILDTRLSWLVYIMGCVLHTNKHLVLSKPDENPKEESLDGELTALVFELFNLTRQRVEIGQEKMPTLQRLQSAIIYFMNMFRKEFMSEHLSSSNEDVYDKLKEFTTGVIDNKAGVCNFIVDMILFVMKKWNCCGRLVTESLDLFLPLSNGVSPPLSTKLNNVRMLLQQQAHASFVSSETKDHLKQRKKFYQTLANLLFRELGSEPAHFDAFMKPLAETATKLRQLSPETFQNPDARSAVIAWFKDLRGILGACSQKKHYSVMFEWMYPYITNHGSGSSDPPLLRFLLSVYQNDEVVANALLRFISDLVDNKSSRIEFGSSSPNGLLLFKEASALLQTYGQPRLAELTAQSPHPYQAVSPRPGGGEQDAASRFKGVRICMDILCRCLEGKFCNFGVFSLYQDKALDEALEVVIKLMLTIPHDVLYSYTKLTAAYTSLMEPLMANHLPFLLRLSQPEFQKLLKSLELGIDPILDLKTVRRVTAAIKQLCTFYHHHWQRASVNPEAILNQPSVAYVRTVQQHLSADPTVLNRMFTAMFHLNLTVDTFAWQISGAILAVKIVADSLNMHPLEEFMQQLMQRARLPELQNNVRASFEKLMKDIGTDLSDANERQFQNNMTMLRHQLKQSV
eukprot:TRINITY_DN8355_c0_g1_i1.p1 TRINITY_DN8355_c0_g1~~TRINITY_DN8355_c0_g1_i1.p1  ORF type:complete len:1148 (+),score=341.98 TRINITY_DN8355_c0_g1_i1:78-3446(+)